MNADVWAPRGWGMQPWTGLACKHLTPDWMTGCARLAAQAQRDAPARAVEGGRVGASVWECTCGSRTATSSLLPPPAPAFPSPYNTRFPLVARAMTSVTSATPDWAERVRESGSQASQACYSGNRVSNPQEGPGAQQSAVSGSLLPPDYCIVHLASQLTAFPAFSQGARTPKLGALLSTFPTVSPAPHALQALLQDTVTSHS